MSPMKWNPVYCEHVLEPDYAFACRHLAAYFFDALSAHLRTVARAMAERGPAIARIEEALQEMRREPLPPFSSGCEDLFFTINNRLEGRLGAGTASYLRLGLSRNDLDMTVYRMHAREALRRSTGRVAGLRGVILRLAGAHVDTVMIAYTHHQPAQPTSLAHYLAAVENALARDHARFMDAYGRLNRCPMGAAALAGSGYGLDRAYTSELLGFAGPVENTYDAVASADWQAESVGAAQICALTLSRAVHDLLLWASSGLISLPPGLVQGSSIMPQKRNPVALEHARARFSKAIGHAQAVMFSSHNIPFGDLNDPGPDVQGALETVYAELGSGLQLLTASLEGCSFHHEAWAKLARESETTATELADELVRRQGVAFGEAHGFVAKLIASMRAQNRPLQDARVEDMVALGGPELPQSDLQRALDPQTFITRRNGFGGPAPEAVGAHLHWASRRLETDVAQVEAIGAKLGKVRERFCAPRKDER